MSHRLSSVWVSDHSGGQRIMLFHSYARWLRGMVYQGEYAKGVVRALSFLPRPIRGRRYKPLRVGHKVRGILVRGSLLRGTGLVLYSKSALAATATVKKRGVLRSPYVFGPACRPRASKRFCALFRHLV